MKLLGEPFIPMPLPQPLAITNLHSDSTDLSVVEISYNWNHTICELLCLASFPWCNILKVHSCCNIQQCIPSHCFSFIHQWACGLLLPFGCCGHQGLLWACVCVLVSVCVFDYLGHKFSGRIAGSRNPMLTFSIAAKTFYIPTNNVQRFQFLHLANNLIFYYYSHPSRCDVVTHCSSSIRAIF